jgi:predicted nucleic acid-binding protein
MRDNVLIDTSVWIAYFQTRPQAAITERVDEILTSNTVCVPKIVLAELIQGAHSEKDLSVIQEFLDAFHIIGEKENTWFEAGKLSYALKKKGKTVNLADCYITIMAKENDCAVLTLDKHFKEIQKEAGLRLLLIQS